MSGSLAIRSEVASNAAATDFSLATGVGASSGLAQLPQFRGRNAAFSAFPPESSLHAYRFQVGGKPQPQPLKQDRLMLSGASDAAFADLDADPRWQDDVDEADLAEFLEDFARFLAQASGVTQTRQGLPEDVGQEADQDMRLDPSDLP